MAKWILSSWSNPAIRNDLTEPIYPSAEIEKVAYFSWSSYLLEPAQVQGVIKGFKNLAADKLYVLNKRSWI
jgi:hypothetical protein